MLRSALRLRLRLRPPRSRSWASEPPEASVAVDRSGLYSGASPGEHSPQAHHTPLETHLRALIRFRGGPLPVAEFMSEVLTHPTLGYYMSRDVFGPAGDFVTSPEVSQLFGELLAVWAASLWEQAGRPAQLVLTELGPGRGTLMADLLRAAAPLAGGAFARALQLHLVEVSPALRRLQADKLGCPPGAGALGRGVTPAGLPVRWHATLDTVPPGPLCLLAHEFFDALPVHQFQLTSRGWRERLVDFGQPLPGQSSEQAPALRFVLAPGPTPASTLLVPRRLAAMPAAAAAGLVALEVCPRGMAVWEAVAARVAAHGGGALAIDYGGEGPLAHTLAAIRRHAFVDLLDAVGTADLSAHVDFGALRAAAAAAAPAALSHGPVEQRALLGGLGMAARLERLLQGADVAQGEALVAGALRLIGDGSGGGSDMGVRYQALALTAPGLGPPAGF